MLTTAPPDDTQAPAILVFDSGLGGLTVLQEALKARPDARYVYIADDAFFPYGGRTDDEIVARVVTLMDELIATHAPALVVIACNTASTIVLPHLRARYATPFVGTVPAIKPACASSRTRRVSVLGTQATVRREYTQALIRDFGQGCDVALVGSARLAPIAEAALSGEEVDDNAIAEEIAPCFVDEGGPRTDTIVLACTHFPLLIERLRRLARWNVDWIDPAPAIARRVRDLLGPAPSLPPPTATPERLAIFTSNRTISPDLAAALTRFGLRAAGPQHAPREAALRR